MSWILLLATAIVAAPPSWKTEPFRDFDIYRTVAAPSQRVVHVPRGYSPQAGDGGSLDRTLNDAGSFDEFDAKLVSTSKPGSATREPTIRCAPMSPTPGALDLLQSPRAGDRLVYLLAHRQTRAPRLPHLGQPAQLGGIFASAPDEVEGDTLEWIYVDSAASRLVTVYATRVAPRNATVYRPSLTRIDPLPTDRRTDGLRRMSGAQALAQSRTDSIEEEDRLSRLGALCTAITYDDPLNDVAAKPMIYLHPRQATRYRISVGDEVPVVLSYPKLRGRSWDVVAFPDGRLRDSSGKDYPALFWTGAHRPFPRLDSGFVVPRDELPATLDSLLEVEGLDFRERDECVTFWMERLSAFPWIQIQFLDRAFDAAMPIRIEPPVDHFLRIFMVFRGLQRPVPLPPQHLARRERGGNYAVEWGGEIPRE